MEQQTQIYSMTGAQARRWLWLVKILFNMLRETWTPRLTWRPHHRTYTKWPDEEMLERMKLAIEIQLYYTRHVFEPYMAFLNREQKD